MKKLLTAVSAALFLFTGCGGNHVLSEDAYTFTDTLDRTVTVTSHDRTAALLGSFADIWTLAGGTVCATAEDAWEDFRLDLPETTVNLGRMRNLSLELLLTADPDFILASGQITQHVAWRETLEAAGKTVAYFDVNSFDDYLALLKICTDLTGREDLYQTYGEDLRTTVDKTIALSEQRVAEEGAQTVLFLRVLSTGLRAKNSHGTVLGEMLADLGCVNIADHDETLLENLSLESILAFNPDRIFVVQMGDDADAAREHVERVFRENPAWYELDAVANGRVHYMDNRLYNIKPNARWGEAYEQLEAILAE